MSAKYCWHLFDDSEHNSKVQVQMDAPSNINKFDLWGIHDMLLAGYACVACKGDVDSAEIVQKATVDFAKLLPSLHPHEACRRSIKEVVDGNPQGGSSLVNRVAEKSWECLDPSLKCKSKEWFCSVEEAKSRRLRDFGADLSRRLGSLEDYKGFAHVPAGVETKLGACVQGIETLWPRACSYWAVIHTLGLRADATKSKLQLLTSLVPIIAGGALLCYS